MITIDVVVETFHVRPINEVDFSLAFLDAIAVVQIGLEQNWANTKNEKGETWPPHAPRTIQIHGPHPLLILSGAMLAAATQTGAFGNITEVSKDAATMGISKDAIPYTHTQNFGDSSRNIPAREYWFATDAVLDEAAIAFGDQAAVAWFGEA